MKTENLGLHITKNLNSKMYPTAYSIRFAVVDLNETEEYPLNFLCILPKFIDSKMNVSNQFSKIFRNQSTKLAVKLLKQELRKQNDPEIIKEIILRLKVFLPKLKNLAKCNICGKDFDAGKHRYKQKKTCRKCKIKKISDY